MICPNTGDVHFGHLIKVVLPSFLHCEVTLFLCNSYVCCVEVLGNCKYPIPHQTQVLLLLQCVFRYSHYMMFRLSEIQPVGSPFTLSSLHLSQVSSWYFWEGLICVMFHLIPHLQCCSRCILRLYRWPWLPPFFLPKFLLHLSL